MKKRVLSLLKSVPNDHPLCQVVESVLMPELQSSIKIEGSDSNLTSEFKHFENIYGRRHDHLIRLNIENHGIDESIASMKAHPGPKRTISIQTQKFDTIVWTDPDCKKLIGLVIVNRLQVNERRDPFWIQLQSNLKEK